MKTTLSASVKNAFLYVGTVIGAGFASGREIALYFGGSFLFSTFISALFLGLFCALFMLLGNLQISAKQHKFGRVNRILEVFYTFACCIVFSAMACGSEYVVSTLLNFKFFGGITTFLCLIFAYRGLDCLKLLNLIIVPLIIGFACLIFFKQPSFFCGGSVSIIKPIFYASLNMLLGGIVMEQAGKTATKLECVLSAVIGGVVLFLLLAVIKLSITGCEAAEMPLFEKSVSLKLQAFSGVLIFLAIFSTQLSAASMLYDKLNLALKNPAASVAVLTLTGFLISFIFSFKQIVDYGYPLVSFFGIITTISGVIRYFVLKKQTQFLSPPSSSC